MVKCNFLGGHVFIFHCFICCIRILSVSIVEINKTQLIDRKLNFINIVYENFSYETYYEIMDNNFSEVHYVIEKYRRDIIIIIISKSFPKT